MKTNLKRISKGFAYAFLFLSLCLFASQLNAQPYFLSGEDPKPTDKVWTKVENMSDEFDGTSVNESKWQIDPVGNGWTWIGRAPGIFDRSAVSVADGNLRVTVSKLPQAQVVNGKTFLYEGAIVRSIDPGQHGWFFEARMKANKTEMSSTFWLMSQNSDCNTKHETDIQECVGVTTPQTASWAQTWDKIFHSNAIHRTTSCNPTPTQRQASIVPPTKNWERYYVYAAWWKSPTEIQFFLDGEYKYSINPSTDFNVPMWIQMAIEVYDWNPVPSSGSAVATETWANRTTQYDWVRVWKLEDAGADDVNCGSLPSSVTSQNAYTVSVPYTASQSRDVVVEFWKDTWLAEGRTNVSSGSGTASVTVNIANAPAAGTDYQWKASIRTVGGDWTTNLDLCTVSNITVNATPTQTPYGGNARTIPGTIEAEHYDEGGQNIAYYDNTTGNAGGTIRTDDVDIEARDGGSSVGWTADGEWLEYTVNTTAGTYDMEARVAAISTGKNLVVKLGNTTLGTISVPNTGGWGTFQTVKLENISVPAGNNQILRLEFDGGATNLNWVKFTEVVVPNDPPTVNFVDPFNNQNFDSGSNVEVEVNASDDGSVANVKLYLNNVLVREEGSAPYNWGLATQNDIALANMAAGNYTLKAIAEDNLGLTAETSISITVTDPTPDQTPYGGSARIIPGTIEAEHYDVGGQNIAYYDNTTGNAGGAIRSDDVDIEARDGGNSVGWTADGEWMEYTVNVTAGTYTIEARVAAISTGKKIGVSLNGISLGSIDVPNTGNWGTFQTVSITNIPIAGGNNKILRLTFNGGATNLNWVKFTEESIPGDVITVQAESFTNTGGTYNDASSGGPGLGVNNATTKINYVNGDDWADYTVNIPQDGAYEVIYYISSPNTGTTVSIGSGSTVWNTTTVPNNGAWDSYQALTASETVNISAGNQAIRLSAAPTTWTWNLDKFTVQRMGAMKSAVLKEQNEKLEVIVYPNPSEGVININCNVSEYSLRVFSSLGIIAHSTENLMGSQAIDLSHLAGGIYFISIDSKEGKEIRRILLK